MHIWQLPPDPPAPPPDVPAPPEAPPDAVPPPPAVPPSCEPPLPPQATSKERTTETTQRREVIMAGLQVRQSGGQGKTLGVVVVVGAVSPRTGGPGAGRSSRAAPGTSAVRAGGARRSARATARDCGRTTAACRVRAAFRERRVRSRTGDR